MKHILSALLLVVMTGAVCNSAQASEPRRVGTYGDWAAYTFMENGNKVCYMASQPKTKEGNYTRRGDIFALITHRPAENTRDVFSYMTGYSYKTGSDVAVTINGNKFTLFTQGDTAWAPDAATDGKIAQAIKSGSNMVVKGTSARGTLTTDTFGLSGSTKAYEKISQECGIN
jgi:hypothetical protein